MDAFSERFHVMIQDHWARPRNFGNLEAPTHHAEGVNPLTGDQIAVEFRTGRSGKIKEAGFTGNASALATASASVMTGKLVGLSPDESVDQINQTLKWISNEEPVPENLPKNEFSILLEIRRFPHRIRCVALAWKTAAAALGSTLHSTKKKTS